MPRLPDRAGACKNVVKILADKKGSDQIMKLESTYSAHNYSPLNVVFSETKGVTVKNPEGKVYYDFLSGYGAVSHGHVHPRVLKVAIAQMKKCTLSSRAFYNDIFGIYANFITMYFGYDKILPMNTGAEGVETALKLARKWGYEKKKIPENKAIIICCTGNFHGRTFGCVSMSDDKSAFGNYGPLLPGFERIEYGNAEELEEILNAKGKYVCGFIAEAIQGEAGVKIPPAGFFKKARELCTKHNVLMIDDEIQAGVGRTGKTLAIEHEGVRPDIVILAKALGAGFLPIAAVLADNPVMEVFTPGTHGSTFGGNPLSCAVAIESLRVMYDEKLPERSAVQGKKLLAGMQEIMKKYPVITAVRGRGLFAAMDFDEKALGGKAGYEYMKILETQGVLAKVTHDNIVRFSPPLVISDKELKNVLNRMDMTAKILQKKIDNSVSKL